MASLSLHLTFLLLWQVASLHNAASATNVSCGSGVLVTATDEAARVELRTYHSTSGSEDTPSYTSREFNGYSLSPECGDLLQKCQTLLVVGINNSGNSIGSSGQLQESIVAVPLSNALGLLALDFSSGIKAEVHVVLPTPGLDCSPQTVHHILNSYYTLCTNSRTGFVDLLELKLNTTHFQKSFFSNVEDIHIDSLYNLTNSVYVELPQKSGHHIYFAAGYSILYYKPLDYILDELDVNLAEYGCSATELEYVGGWDMLVYCHESRALYINLNYEDVSIPPFDYAKYGRPYVCPNPDVYLGVHSVAKYIEYGFFSTQNTTEFEVSMGVYDNGVCFGSEDTSLFAFTDRELGTRILRASASEGFIMSLSDTTCINYRCPPLVVLEDRYLVLREKRQGDWLITLFDSHNNFSLVQSVPHIKADLLAIVDKCVTTTGSSSSSPTPTVSPFRESKSNSNALCLKSNFNNKKHWAIGYGVGGGLIVLGVIVGAVFAFALFMIWKHKNRTNNFAIEQYGHNDSSFVTGTVMEETVRGGVFETQIGNGGLSTSPTTYYVHASEANQEEGVQESGITKQDKDTQEMVANNVDINSDVKPLLSSCSS